MAVFPKPRLPLLLAPLTLGVFLLTPFSTFAWEIPPDNGTLSTAAAREILARSKQGIQYGLK